MSVNLYSGGSSSQAVKRDRENSCKYCGFYCSSVQPRFRVIEIASWKAELIRAAEFARFSIDSESDLKELESIADSFDLNFESILDDVSSRRFMEDEDVLDVES